MPFYEFRCTKCRHVFEELFFSIGEKRAVICPKCKSKKTKRMMSVFGGRVGSASAGGGCGTCASTTCSPT